MGIILNANYRIWKTNKKQTVPAPVDSDTPHVDWWYDHIAKLGPSIRQAGFTVVLLPPPCKTQGGHANDSDGYGKYDDYDLGDKNQCWSVATRFGTAEQFRRCVAVLHACGLQVYTDFVLHQYDGGNSGTYKYVGADGKTLNGRFPKTPDCFVNSHVSADPVFNTEGNYAFGDMVAYINGQPHDYMAKGAIDASDYLVQTSGVDGGRLDDVKGSNSGFIHRLATSKSLANLYLFGEMFDGNPDEISRWIWTQGMNGRCGAIDFTAHWHLQSVCDNNGNAADLLNPNSAYLHRDSIHAVTYVESPDTDLSPGQQIISNKGLAYWFILTSEGYPQIYYRDYSSDPYCYGLHKVIDNLNWIHENLAFGTTISRHADSRVICFERTGYPGLLSAANWDTWSARTITVQTNFGPNVELHDYSGNVKRNIWTDGQGKATFTVPSNAYSSGRSFVCWSRTGYSQPFKMNRIATRQVFYGAEDLPIGPVPAIGSLAVGHIWADKGFEISLDRLSTPSHVSFGLLDQSGNMVNLSGSRPLKATTHARGRYTITAKNSSTAATPFEVAVRYFGTQGIYDSEVIR